MLSDLYEIVQGHIPEKVLAKRNSHAMWEYGYDEEFDVIVISKDGTIGDIYYMNGLYIALPAVPKDRSQIESENNKWVCKPLPSELAKLKTMADWMVQIPSFQDRWSKYIETEFDRREHGFWFRNNGVDTYITGSHYMYLQWTKTDVGNPDYREANRLFWIYWEACVADDRCYGMVYVKIRRSGFSWMGASELVNSATINKNKRIGILSKTGDDAKTLFTDKVVNISKKYPFFFKPIQDGSDNPKSELAYRVPATRLTKKKMSQVSEENELEGLDTSIDWKATEDNSYDGEKLFRLVHDESGKWITPKNIKNNWKVVKTCLRLGSRIVGKCMMGSTVNPMNKGGKGFKDIFYDSDPRQRTDNNETNSGLYGLFIPMEDNYEGHIDEYGFPVYQDPTELIKGADGLRIKQGAVTRWENDVKAKKKDAEELNEHYRQFPRTLAHAFRDEIKSALFNIERIYAQIDYNDSYKKADSLTRGSFMWENGVRFSKVKFEPNKNGRFLVSWIPPLDMQNRVGKNGNRYTPLNGEYGAFGCDPYDISGVVGGGGSKGALHGKTMFSINSKIPSNAFFLEYISRPQTAEVFFEDVLMACWFYGMPILAENNKPRLLYHFKNAGCRLFSLNRPDKAIDKLSTTEKEIGGIPNNSEDIIQAHAAGIESYIEQYIGYIENGEDGYFGNMPFEATLEDWSKFDIRNRTAHDASISSGLAIMATNRHLFRPTQEKKRRDIILPRFDNSGQISRAIRDKN